MVIKIHKSIAVHASLKYVIGKMDDENNRIIMFQNVPESDNPLTAIREEFRRRDIANIRSERVSFHASINPSAEELEKIDIQQLCKEYMSRMGYADQPYIVVEHNDTGRRHYHIVSHRIKPNGKKINSSNEIIKTNKFVKELNKRLRQHTIKGIAKDEKIKAFNPDKSYKKKQIQDIWTHACSYKYSSLDEFSAILNSYSIEMGINDDKTYAAGMKNGKRATRAFVVDKMIIKPTKSKDLSSRDKERLRNIVKFAMRVSLTENHAKNILSHKDIGLTLLKNESGGIYGVYIIDHKNKIVFKASDLSRDIAANQWAELQNNKWDKISLDDKSQEKRYHCNSWEYAGNFMYNYWENADLSYKDLKYSRRREIGRKK